MLNDARHALGLGEASAETSARRSLESFRSAMDWLEGEDGFDAAHAQLDAAGRFCREEFTSGCALEQTGGDFAVRCPVRLAHNRVGFSIGFYGNAICSICEGDASECPHRPGRVYEVPAATLLSARCNICAERQCDSHQVGRLYMAEARVIVTDGTLEEVSLVGVPRQPDARIHLMTIPRRDLESLLGPIPDDAIISCDHCLEPCPGLAHFDGR